MTTITSTVRGGGVGGSAWIAKITGPDAKWTFARKFCAKTKALSKSGRSGHIHFHLDEPGLYEVRGVQLDSNEASIGTLWNGFVQVAADGSYVKISRDEALAIITPATVTA